MTTILVQLTPSDLYRGKPIIYEVEDTLENRRDIARLVKVGNYNALKIFCEDHCEGRKRNIEFWCRQWI
jgi:hypothetical protein